MPLSRSSRLSERPPSCLDNINHGLSRAHPRSFNRFMYIAIETNGKITVKPPRSKAEDKIILWVEMDGCLDVAACSISESDCNSEKLRREQNVCWRQTGIRHFREIDYAEHKPADRPLLFKSSEVARQEELRRQEDADFYFAICLKQTGRVIGGVFAHPKATVPGEAVADTFSLLDAASGCPGKGICPRGRSRVF